MKDTVYFGDEVSKKLASGIRKVSQPVGGTMGTGGSNAIIEALQHPYHLVTNDGYSIANSIHLEDPIENIGKNILLEAINRANKSSGDGSSTTCVLTSAIIEEGMKQTDISPMEMKRSLEECIPVIEESINKQKREISVDDVWSVAAISAEDEYIGRRIGDIYKEIGKDGIIHWDISRTSEDSYTIGTGITVEGATYASPYMCDATESGQNTNQIRLKNPTVLITRQKISSAAEFNEIFSALYAKDIKDIVVFCDEYEPLIINDLILTRAKRGFRTILVKLPTIWKDQWYEDLALASGAKVVDVAAGLPLKSLKIEHLGRFENIVITKDQALIDGIQDLSLHVRQLEEDGTDDSKVRIARLNTKTARYFVGAHSDSALSYRRLKVEDAISAAAHALNGGIVAGGGSALASVKLLDSVGGKILSVALKAPAKQIGSNSGMDLQIGSDYEGGRGFDTRTKQFVDMFEAKITDPATIVLTAAKNAISVAATVLTASTVITLPRETLEEPKANILNI